MKLFYPFSLFAFVSMACSNGGSDAPLDMGVDAEMRVVLDQAIDAQLPDAEIVVIPDAEADVLDLAVVVDAETLDMMIVDAEVPEPCNITFDIHSPAGGSFGFAADGVDVTGYLRDGDSGESSYGELIIYDSNSVVVSELTTTPTGRFDTNVSITPQGGEVSLTLGARVAGKLCTETETVSFRPCNRRYRDDFTTLSDNWRLYNDATWDEGGWLEITGNAQFKRGAAINPFEVISRGQSSIRFSIITGGGRNSLGGGGDGYALSIVEPVSLETFEALIAAGYPGGGLGYAVAGSYSGDDFTLENSMLTIEIDTYHNSGSGQNWHVDPTVDSHIEITRDGDPGNSVTFFPVPDIEDLEPHQIQVDILADRIKIYFDGNLAVDHEVSLVFKGGYLFFSGSTGAATNFHRIDEIEILHECY